MQVVHINFVQLLQYTLRSLSVCSLHLKTSSLSGSCFLFCSSSWVSCFSISSNRDKAKLFVFRPSVPFFFNEVFCRHTGHESVVVGLFCMSWWRHSRQNVWQHFSSLGCLKRSLQIGHSRWPRLVCSTDWAVIFDAILVTWWSADLWIKRKQLFLKLEENKQIIKDISAHKSYRQSWNFSLLF